ncbi:MAG TPA: type VII secretion protein EccB [Actinocrinis sp.]|nr:type VII secretion protein EccB [Actinocrinis sp.]
MANGKEQLDAFKFGRRRIVANLIAPSPTGSDEGAPRPVRTFFASIMIGVVGVATMIVLGYLHPTAPSGWQSGLAEDSTTGAAYVFNGGELHPVLNITSAQLLLGTNFHKYDVPDSVIVAQKTGAPYGILGAPPVVPAAGQVGLTGWTMCQKAKNPANQAVPGGQTVLEIGYDQSSMTAVTGANGFIVHDSKGDDYLLYGDFSYLISPVRGLMGSLDGSGNDATGPVGPWVDDSFLRAFQPGSPISAFPTVQGLGGPVTAANQPPNARIGSFGNFATTSGTTYYIETESGLAQVTEFVYNLYASNGALAGAGVGGGFNPPLTQSEITNAVPIDEQKNPADIRGVGATWPTAQVNIQDLDPIAPSFSVLCVNYDGKFDPTQGEVPLLTMWYGAQTPDPGGAGVQSTGDQYANLIDVLPGHAALSRDVANGNSATAGPVYLTVATGSRYELMTDQPPAGTTGDGKSAQDQLQYKAITPEPVPDNWMSLVPAGARLDPAAAGRPYTSTQ